MQPNISKETLNRMAEFFLNTSVPRIIAEERKKNLEHLKHTPELEQSRPQGTVKEHPKDNSMTAS